jgi:hypothetical protein
VFWVLLLSWVDLLGALPCVSTEWKRERFSWGGLVSPTLLYHIFFGFTGVWTPGVTLARKALYHLNHAPILSYFSYFPDRVSCFSMALASDLPCRLTGASLFVEGSSITFCTGWSQTEILQICLPSS